LTVLLVLFHSLVFCQSDSTSNPEVDEAISLVNTVESNNNFLDQLTPDSAIALPFGIARKIGEVRYVIAVDSVKFKPGGAYFGAYAAIDFPGTNKKIAFRALNVKFNPKGVVGGNQARLMLVSEHSIKINNTVTLKLKPDGQNFVEWDCNGFKAISLKGYFVFSKGKLKPDSTQTTEPEVTASFQIYTNDIHNFIAQVNITPFTMEGLKNWSFKVTDATVDMSELVNAPGMAFPAGYNNPNMVTQQMWTGFYLKELKVKLPTEISKTGKRTEIQVNNLLIDHMGVTGLFQVNNIFQTGEGSMSGWGFSLDELGVGFVCNQLNSGHLKGNVNIPVMDSAQALTFNANLYYNPQNKEVDYSFVINPASTLNFKVFTAQVDLYNTSSITIAKHNGLFKPTAVLNGKISFTGEKFNSNGGYLVFQDLTIVTVSPYLTNGLFTLHTNGSQTKAAKYPVSINDITFGLAQGAPVLGFSVTLNFSESESSGLAVGTLVQIKGKIEASQQSYTGEAPVSITKTNWKFDRVSISGISLDIKTSVFKLNGLIIFRDDDPVYGDGFFGSISLSIEDVLPQPVVVTVCFGSKTEYKYFYYDAAVPVTIPLGNIPITLTKLMGGAYYHMRPQNASQAQLIAASQNQPATATNALSYVPDQTMSVGFKAGVGFIYSSSETVVNGDVMLEIAFTSSGGLSFVKLAGDVYAMSTRSERPTAPVKGNVVIQYDAENKVFDMTANVIINAYNSITGTATSKFHIEPGIWYLSVGKPSSPANVNVLNMVTAQSYFMVGNQIEPALAPPPEVSNIISQSGLNANRDQSQLQSGKGFCTGMKIYSNFYKEFGLSFFQVYGGFNFGSGFDMMLMNYGNATCSGSGQKVGMNGWLASGNMYIYLQGSVGVKGDLTWSPGCDCEKKTCFCKEFNKTIFDAGVAAIISGKMPKPVFLQGQLGCYYNILDKVSGNFNFDYTYGADCNIVN
jgi:hypothetical protein